MDFFVFRYSGVKVIVIYNTTSQYVLLFKSLG